MDLVDMEDYVNPTKIDFDPSLFLVHIGTNDSSREDAPKVIADQIIKTAEALKRDKSNVAISICSSRRREIF